MTSIVAPIQYGKPVFSRFQRKLLDEAFARLEGQEAKITVTKRQRTRSMNQNAYYHSVCVAMIAADTGHNPEEVHEFLKMKLLPRQFVEIGGDAFMVAKSTTRLSTAEMEEYLTKVRIFAAVERGLYIPLPNEI